MLTTTHAKLVRALKLKPLPQPSSGTIISIINQLSQFYITPSIGRSDRHVVHGLDSINSTFTSQFRTNFPEWQLKGKLVFCPSKKLFFSVIFSILSISSTDQASIKALVKAILS